MSVFRYIFRKVPLNGLIQEGKINCNGNILIYRRISTFEYTSEKDPAPIFFNNETQNLLQVLTRLSHNKIFRKRKMEDKKLELPLYKFMTEEQLTEAKKEAEERANELLQMPPVVRIREPINQILSQDPALQGLDTSRTIFTDITFGIKNCDRLIVVREPDGTLQKAEWSVRDRMNQVYFPIKGREYRIPKMFEDSFIIKLLDKKEYEFVLDRACIQFEPDDPEYQRICSTTYLHANDNNEFDLLRSTRHFGPFAFFLTWFNKIDNLLLELIETAHIEDALTLIKLYGSIHKVEFDANSENAVELYIKEISDKKGPLELALQSYKELEKERRDLEQGIKVAHGLV